jgi:predicted nucleotidyltransferase component of viral defense system
VLERRHVTFYARSSGVTEDRAERDIILTYVLHILSDRVLPRLAFKGGTCLKKIYFGNTGRFSMDLDFTSIEMRPEELGEEIRGLLHEKSWYGIDFEVSEENSTSESYLAVVRYAHTWNPGSLFELQVSFREQPIYPPVELPIFDEMYFKFSEFQSFPVKCMQRDEVLSEKIRAAFQRANSRDLYDLYLFAGRPFNRELVKVLVVIKCWNVRDPFNPELFLDKLGKGDYDWEDLGRLVRKGSLPQKEEVTKRILDEYAFLGDMNDNLLKIARDSKAHREKKLVARQIAVLRNPSSS